MNSAPDRNVRYPIPGNQNVQFIQNTLTRENIVAGAYSYYDASDGESFEDRVLYHYDFIGDRLVIGKFCQIARNATFVMNGANHKLDGFSTFPFFIFGGGWALDPPALDELPYKGDTNIGNDVWIGMEALIMPGVTVGDGAIIAARSVVTKDVRPYAVVGGNPASEIRRRFSDSVVDELVKMRWWDWDLKKITSNIGEITGANLEAMRAVAT